ncbi:cyclic lactone autoinducer peptide [Staphylococcus hominis]|nr:cyclic lactone autoinducer peptide [Staphylococcus hominis]AUJ52858.1 accessory regulator AgrD [Staphylococcus hominis subsp. hominis]AYY66941.1 cyclic lactone autoinducer peptide [Staphylococcus hominis]MCI2839633.1 cyclic lactone autoinducer peptide [Staphylococcus hominis]MCI2847933.1 cyclic lactone autoinducer peptide [Staphylococcus hominis]MCI2850107.1 cyclic lactone autoinducer peptide [Staphylococcus hominis]
MTFITDLFIKLFSLILETVGTLASYSPCATYFDEPEVPKELTNLER